MAHHPHPPQVRDAILARVAAGELIQDICAEPGAPSVGAVCFWARRDPAWGAALAAAKAAGREVRRQPSLAFDEPTAKALIARLAAGGTIPYILRDPAMPGRRAYAHWRATQAWFAEEVGRQNAIKEAEKTHRNRRRFRRFDPALADRIVDRMLQGGYLREVIAADPELPAQHVVRRWRAEQPDFDAGLTAVMAVTAARRRYGARCTPALMDQVWRRMLDGDTLATIGLQPDMPCRATLYAWLRTRPDFFRTFVEGLDARQALLDEQARDFCRRTAPGRDARAQLQSFLDRADRIRDRLDRLGVWEDEDDDL